MKNGQFWRKFTSPVRKLSYFGNNVAVPSLYYKPKTLASILKNPTFSLKITSPALKSNFPAQIHPGVYHATSPGSESRLENFTSPTRYADCSWSTASISSDSRSKRRCSDCRFYNRERNFTPTTTSGGHSSAAERPTALRPSALRRSRRGLSTNFSDLLPYFLKMYPFLFGATSNIWPRDEHTPARIRSLRPTHYRGVCGR